MTLALETRIDIIPVCANSHPLPLRLHFVICSIPTYIHHSIQCIYLCFSPLLSPILSPILTDITPFSCQFSQTTLQSVCCNSSHLLFFFLEMWNKISSLLHNRTVFINCQVQHCPDGDVKCFVHGVQRHCVTIFAGMNQSFAKSRLKPPCHGGWMSVAQSVVTTFQSVDSRITDRTHTHRVLAQYPASRRVAWNVWSTVLCAKARFLCEFDYFTMLDPARGVSLFKSTSTQ